MTMKKLIESMDKLSKAIPKKLNEATEETKTGRIHKGTYGTSHEAGDDVKKEPTQRGRGRPKKDADETGEVKKYDFSAFTKPAKVGKHQGNVTKHSLKEWMQMVDEGEESEKDKKFAKLAPPKDKITYADKIAGAKKDKNDVSEGTEETKTGRIHKGTYGTSHEAGDDVKKAPTVRGRGRPKKDADETGEVKKYDFSAFTKPAKVGKHQGNVTKHSLKEMDSVQVTPSKPQAGQMDITKNGKVVATADRTKATQMADAIKKGTVKISDPNQQAGTSLGGTVSEGSVNYDKHSMMGKIRRGIEADNKGWGQAGKMMHAQDDATAEKALRNGNRYYNMTRGNNKTAGGFPKTTIESMAESRRLKESVDALEHIMSKFKFETKQFIENDDLDHDLYEALFDYYQDSGDIPYGVAKGRTGDPFEWVSEKFREELTNRGLIEDMLEPSLTPQMGGMSHTDTLAARHDKDATRAIQFESWSNQLAALLNEGMTVSSSTGNEESPDTVSITATDADAEQLLSIVRNAGLGVFGGDSDLDDEPGSPAGGFSVDSLGSDEDDYENESDPEGTPDSINVVDDGDAMLDLIKKIAGVSDAGPEMSMDSDEECGSDSASVYTTDTETDSDVADEEGDYEEEGSSDEESGEDDYEDEESSEDDYEDEGSEDESSEDDYDDESDDEEKVDESVANSADDQGEYDLQYIMRLISGGMNGEKRDQSVGNITKIVK